MSIKFKALIVFLSITLVSHAAYKYYVRKKKNKLAKEIHEAIMFSPLLPGEIGELRKSKYSRCKITYSMDRLLFYINSPRKTLDICIYVVTNMDLANAVLKLHYKGIKVRIIVDADMAFSTGSSIRRLEKQGIAVRWMKSTNLMHHKFCLIDATVMSENVIPKLMLGSLNWTNQAISGNWEDIVVTSQRDLVRQYSEEFERLWILFKPVVDVVH